METVQTTTNHLVLLAELAKTSDCRFASLIYTNQKGESSKYLLHLNVHYLKVLARDLKVLQSTKPENDTEALALQELIESLKESIETKGHNSRYTKEGYYTPLFNGVKFHENELYVNAFVIKREVLIKGTYKEVNSSAKTIAKNKFRKLLKSGQFREFKIDLNQVHMMKLNGKTLVIE